METLRVLTERISCTKLVEPAPEMDEMEIVFQAALRAPDHGRLTPWLFITVEKNERIVLGEMIYDSLKESDLGLTEVELIRWKTKTMSAPMIIIAVAKIKDHPKIPESDMILSTAAAIQNMNLALFDMSYSSYWRTGIIVQNEKFKERLNLKIKDKIIGFLYIGTPQDNFKEIPDRNSSDYFIPLQKWMQG